MQTLKALVSGRVQGVGYRYFTKRKADQLGVKGYAKNLPNGQVEVVMQGEADALAALKRELSIGHGYARVESVDCIELMDWPDLNAFSTE